jgi:SIR2-like domain
MLFVGAGASKPFGTPVLAELTSEVKSVIGNAGYGDLWGHVYDSLKEASKKSDGYFTSEDEVDMEVVLSVIDFIMDPVAKAMELGPSLLYALPKNLSEKLTGMIPSMEEYSSIRKEIEKRIVDSCNNVDFQKAKEYYGKLFKLELDLHRRYCNAKGEGSTTLPFEYAVTTNYDLLLERYAFESDHDNNLPGKDFFNRGFRRERAEAVDMYLQPGQLNNDLRYLKLHGSIDWWVRSRDGLVTTRESDVSLFGEKYSNRVMIYPAYEKKVSREPFASLHTYFSKILQSDDVYIVIGYSFRDQSINDSFLDALTDDKKRMIIVNPGRKKIRSKLRSFPLERIDVILRPFGDSELFNDLEDTITRKPQGFES